MTNVKFKVGDKVEVKAGLLKGIAGDVVRINKKDRLVVRVDAIQHSVSVQIDSWTRIQNLLEPMRLQAIAGLRRNKGLGAKRL